MRDLGLCTVFPSIFKIIHYLSFLVIVVLCNRVNTFGLLNV